VPREVLDDVVEAITSAPEGFAVHPKLAKWWEANRKALDEDKVLWPLAEQLAWGTLLHIQVVVPTTPAQYFHALRRQALREVKKPLVVFTPKSLLRMAATSSRSEDFTSNTFRPVLPDPNPPSNPSRLVLCSGKVFYDLAKAREDKPVAIVRVEELYPFPEKAFKAELERYSDAEVVWVQEEPENMGAWWYMERQLRSRLGVEPKVVARAESASPATGSQTIHQREQELLIQRRFGSA
jgi:2-oxoglutarate dehydrogenase complex dehydrogenase (E1) component-like enzyme